MGQSMTDSVGAVAGDQSGGDADAADSCCAGLIAEYIACGTRKTAARRDHRTAGEAVAPDEGVRSLVVMADAERCRESHCRERHPRDSEEFPRADRCREADRTADRRHS